MDWLITLMLVVISATFGALFGVAMICLFMCNAADERRDRGRDIHPDWEIDFKEVDGNDQN